MNTPLKLVMFGAAAYGGYALWSRHGARSGGLGTVTPSAQRIQERSELNAEELAVGSANPVAQAAAILTESEERTRLPRTADGIEHRRSEDTVEP